MKSRVLFLVMVAIFSLSNSFAAAEDLFNNTKCDEAGRPVEVETYIKGYTADTLIPTKKTCYSYDTGGNCLEKVYYEWDSQDMEWGETKKVKCTYDAEGKMISMVNYTWNDKKKDWKESSTKHYVYDKDGNPVTN